METGRPENVTNCVAGWPAIVSGCPFASVSMRSSIAAPAAPIPYFALNVKIVRDS